MIFLAHLVLVCWISAAFMLAAWFLARGGAR